MYTYLLSCYIFLVLLRNFYRCYVKKMEFLCNFYAKLPTVALEAAVDATHVNE